MIKCFSMQLYKYCKTFYCYVLVVSTTLKPGPHYDISINISITGLCRNEDSRDLSITLYAGAKIILAIMLSLSNTQNKMADELHLLAIRWIFVSETQSQVPYDWLNSLIYSYAYVSVVLTSDISNITISISTRRTEDFDNLVFVLILMSRLSSLRHKTRYAYVYAYVVVRTRLNQKSFQLIGPLGTLVLIQD